MKIGKTGLILIVVGIPLIALGGMGMSRSQQFEEQNQLRAKLDAAKQTLARLQAEKQSTTQTGLEKQISEMQQNLETAAVSLSPDTNSISTDDWMLNLAWSCGVAVKQIESPGLTARDLYELKSSAITVNMVLEGSVNNIIDLVCKLNGKFESGTVDSVNIAYKPEKPDNIVEAKIQYTLYSYKGS